MKKLIILKLVLLAFILTTAGCSNEAITDSPESIDPTDNFSTDNFSKVNTRTHKEHDFNNGKLDPFVEDQGFKGNAIFREGMGFHNDGRGGKRLKLTWKESEYDGSRRERGHEIKLNVNGNKEVYTGFYLNIPKGQRNNLLNKNTIIWQLYNWNTDGCSNWTAHLELKKNDLYLSYRNACVNPTTVKILDNIKTDRPLAFQIRCVLSNTKRGTIKVLMDGKTLIDRKGINLGFGKFNKKGEAKTSVAGVKMGMYAADTKNYKKNEVRILYLDNVGSTFRKGSIRNSFNLIDPRRM